MASITWSSAVSADWSTAADWLGGVVPGGTDDVVLNAAGSYVISIAGGESFSLNSLNVSGGGTVAVSGTLNFANAGGSSFSSGPLTILAGGVLSGEGFLLGSGAALNQGTVSGNAAIMGGGQPLLISASGTFTNQGLMLATNGGNLDIDAGGYGGAFANIAGDTLTGGIYQADPVSTLVFVTAGSAPAFTTLDATLILSGDGATIANNEAGTSTFASIEDSLSAIGAAGVLNVLGGRGYSAGVALTDAGAFNLGGGTLSAPGLGIAADGALIGFGTVLPTIANAGTVEAKGGFLTLAGGVSDGGTLAVDANATMVLNGAFAGSIIDDGTVQAQGGTLTLNGSVGGGGGFVIQGGASLSATTTLALGAGADKPVAFNGAFGDLVLNAPPSFTSIVTGFGSGDTIDLSGILANGATLAGGTLAVTSNGSTVDTLALAGDYGGAVFNAGTDNAGGTDLTVSGVAPRDYVFEGPYWQSKTITWSFAASNLSGDSNAPFSDFFDGSTQSAEMAVVQQALARWAGVAGLNFVEVPDSAAVDIRIGWGDLLNAGLGEIGQASFKFDANGMIPDGIVRIEDPVETALTAEPSVIGGLAYNGQVSTLYQIALHEIGHALGMGHSTDANAVMFPTAQGATNQDLDASDMAGISALYAAVACYAAGSRVLTARGEVPVEQLRVGELVPVLDGGRLLRVRWIGQRHADAATPIRVCAGAFGAGRPHRDLLLSPDHALFADGALIPVQALRNGVTVTKEPCAGATYFHIELQSEDGAPAHAVLLAEGLAAESYLDTGNRRSFEDEPLLPVVAALAERRKLGERLHMRAFFPALVFHEVGDGAAQAGMRDPMR